MLIYFEIFVPFHYGTKISVALKLPWSRFPLGVLISVLLLVIFGFALLLFGVKALILKYCFPLLIKFLFSDIKLDWLFVFRAFYLF